MSGKRPGRRKVVRLQRFEREVAELLRPVDGAESALRGFEHVVARLPDELGMAVPREPDYRQRPIHVGGRSFTILYTFDDRVVTLVAIREVFGGLFG